MMLAATTGNLGRVSCRLILRKTSIQCKACMGLKCNANREASHMVFTHPYHPQLIASMLQRAVLTFTWQYRSAHKDTLTLVNNRDHLATAGDLPIKISRKPIKIYLSQSATVSIRTHA